MLSDSGVPIEEISRLVGHRSTLVRKPATGSIRPVIQSGATVMDHLFMNESIRIGGQFGGQRAENTKKAFRLGAPC